MKINPLQDWVTVGYFVRYILRCKLGWTRAKMVREVEGWQQRHSMEPTITYNIMRRLENGHRIREHSHHFYAIECVALENDLQIHKGILLEFLHSPQIDLTDTDSLIKKFEDVVEEVHLLGKQGHFDKAIECAVLAIAEIDQIRYNYIGHVLLPATVLRTRLNKLLPRLNQLSIQLHLLEFACTAASQPRHLFFNHHAARIIHKVNEYQLQLRDVPELRLYYELALMLKPTAYYTSGQHRKAEYWYHKILPEITYDHFQAMIYRDLLVISGKVQCGPCYNRSYIAAKQLLNQLDSQLLQAKLVEGQAWSLHLFQQDTADALLNGLKDFYKDLFAEPTSATHLQYWRSLVCVKAGRGELDLLMELAPHAHDVMFERGALRYVFQIETALERSPNGHLRQLGGHLKGRRLGF